VRAPPEGEAALAGHLHRLAVLIAAGLAPRAAWAHVAAAADDAVLASIAARIDDGDEVSDAIESVAESLVTAGGASGTRGGSRSDAGAAWRSLAAAWRVAAAAGAPLAPALRGFAEGLRDREAARRDIRVALAGPLATARIVMLLPVVAVVLGLLMGVDLVATVSTPVGAGAIVAGLVLVSLARRWMRGLVRAAAPPPPTVGLALDLLAVAAGGGGSPEAAAALVSAEVQRAHPATADAQGDEASGLAALDPLVRLSRAAGAPLGELARADAAEARNRARAQAREGAEQLAVRLMLPLGACILPAFLLLGVVPMLIGLLSSTTLAW
jgi:tight adherence protein B